MKWCGPAGASHCRFSLWEAWFFTGPEGGALIQATCCTLSSLNFQQVFRKWRRKWKGHHGFASHISHIWSGAWISAQHAQSCATCARNPSGLVNLNAFKEASSAAAGLKADYLVSRQEDGVEKLHVKESSSALGLQEGGESSGCDYDQGNTGL